MTMEEILAEQLQDAIREGRARPMPDTGPWDNEPTLLPGRPYDGAIVKDGRLIIPN